MNLFKKLVEVTTMSSSLSSPKEMKFGITKKEWIDLGLVLVVSFLIVVYKVNKA